MAHIVFTMEDGSEVYADLNADIVTVGRHPESMVVLPSGSVSGQHATIKRRGDSYFVQDLGTTNGTRVNGVEVEEVKLEDGDLVAMGDIAGYFCLTDDAAVTAGAGQAEGAGADEPLEPVVLPIPDEPSPPLAEPSLFLPDKYSPVPRKQGHVIPPITRAGRPVKRYKESSNVGGFLLFLLFLVFAFLVGLHVRHGQEANSFLLKDIIEKYRTKVEPLPTAIDDEAAAKPEEAPQEPAPAPANSSSTEAATPAPASEPPPAPSANPGMDGDAGATMGGEMNMSGGAMMGN